MATRKDSPSLLLMVILHLSVLSTCSSQLACTVCQCHPSLTSAQGVLYCPPDVNFTALPNDIPDTIESIIASGSHIGQLTQESFKNVTVLAQIDLSSNQISMIANGTFMDTWNLTTLTLSDNKIEILWSETFQGLGKLTTLKLNGNRITSLPPRVFVYLSSIERIDLQQNSIKMIGLDVFYGCSALVHLDLSSNNMTHIVEDAFQNLDNLTTLDISGNDLMTFFAEWLVDKSPDIGFIADNDGDWFCTKPLKKELDKINQTHAKVVDCDNADKFCPTCSNLNGKSLANLTLEMLPEVTTPAQATTGIQMTNGSRLVTTAPPNNSSGKDIITTQKGNSGSTKSASQKMGGWEIKWITLAQATLVIMCF